MSYKKGAQRIYVEDLGHDLLVFNQIGLWIQVNRARAPCESCREHS